LSPLWGPKLGSKKRLQARGAIAPHFVLTLIGDAAGVKRQRMEAAVSQIRNLRFMLIELS
jgi:hypothetical protein